MRPQCAQLPEGGLRESEGRSVSLRQTDDLLVLTLTSLPAPPEMLQTSLRAWSLLTTGGSKSVSSQVYVSSISSPGDMHPHESAGETQTTPGPHRLRAVAGYAYQ